MGNSIILPILVCVLMQMAVGHFSNARKGISVKQTGGG